MIGYLLFGGKLSNDLLLQLNEKELKELETIEKNYSNGELAYETSIFIDSCIEKRIKSGKIHDWSSLPIYVPSNVKRVLKKAVLNHEKRYKNVSEFLNELSKIMNKLPDWMNDGKYILTNWKGNDYLLLEENGKPVLKKRKHSIYDNKCFRIDNNVRGITLTEAYEQLKINIGLP